MQTARSSGKKELIGIGIGDGYRESEQSWKELLLDCKSRGLEIEPSLAIGDGALGFWAAMRKVWHTTKEQRRWVHKTANVLDKVPKSSQPKTKGMLHWMHIRTTNPIESTFATVRLRHSKTKGSGTRKVCLTMVFKLMESASKKWRGLNGSSLLPEVIAGIVFVNGVKKSNAA